MMPTIERVYQVDDNNRITASGTPLTDNKATLLAIVGALISFGSHPMTVAASSNGTTAGAANHWTTGADLVWHASGSPFSWITLTDPAGFQVLIALDATSADGHLASVYLSAGAGFTGGSTTTRPTATDEVPLVSGAAWGGVTASTADIVVHVLHEANQAGGLAVIILSAGDPIGFWYVSKVKDPITTGWAPAVIGCVRTGGDAMTLAGLNAAAGVKAKIADVVDLFMTAESFNGGTLAAETYVDDQTGDYTLTPIGLHCTTTRNRGRKGSIFDLWFGQTMNNSGDTYPGDGSRQLVQFGHLVFPWNGTIVQIT